MELYPQVAALRADLFGSFDAFTKRFCDAKRGRFVDWDVSGASNLDELYGLLRHLMVRPASK